MSNTNDPRAKLLHHIVTCNRNYIWVVPNDGHTFESEQQQYINNLSIADVHFYLQLVCYTIAKPPILRWENFGPEHASEGYFTRFYFREGKFILTTRDHF